MVALIRLLLAACAGAGVTRLHSEDMQHGAPIDGVKIINPVQGVRLAADDVDDFYDVSQAMPQESVSR